MIRIRFVCLAVLAFSLGTAAAWGGPAAWTGQGPFGGRVDRVTVDPNAGSRLYAATGNGFFRSVDGGLSWQRAETGLLAAEPIRAVLAPDPNVTNALWLTDDIGRLYRSTDGASHWTPTGDAPSITEYGVTGLAAVRGELGVLYETGIGIGVRKSIDGGVTFATLGGGLPAADYLHVAVDPANASNVIAIAATDCAAESAPTPIYRSTDAGATWVAVVPTTGCAYTSYWMDQAVFGPVGSHRVYALINQSLFRSDDNGASFVRTGLQAGVIGVSPASADVLWLGVGPVGLSQGHVPQKSLDGGYSATAYATGMTTNGEAVPNVVSIAVHPDYPATPRVWMATANAGIFQSSNDGASWSEQNDGLTATLIRALAVHPFAGSRMYAGVGDAFDPSPAFYRSNTIGGWVPSNSGLGAHGLRAIAIDPTTASDVGSTVIYAVGNGMDVDTTGVAKSRNSGIYKSVDGGLAWSTLSTGFPNDTFGAPGGKFAGQLRSIALDPRSCANPPVAGPCTSGPLRTAYVVGSGTRVAGEHHWRVIKTTDGGATWASSDTGLPPDVVGPPGSYAYDALLAVVPLVIDPLDPQTLYIGTFASAVDAAENTVSPTVPNGVFKSIDGGANWVHKSTGLPRYPGSTDSALDVLSLAIDPLNPQTLWASTINGSTFAGPGKIYKSTDGAAHWTLSNAGVTAPDTRALLVDPDDPSIVYAASGGLGVANPGGVYKSVDGGANWNSVSLGLPASAALVLALDPNDSRILHAGTSGGVYTMTQLPDSDHDGVPDLIENAGPNGGDADDDNTPDSAQANVSTTALGLLGNNVAWQRRGSGDGVQAQLADLHRVLASGTVGGYFTIKTVSGDCTHSVDVAPVGAGSFGRDSVAHHGRFDYPRGLVRFELPECTNAIVDVIFNGANFGNDWSWRYYGPQTAGDDATMGWHDATSIVTSRTTTTWRLHLAAGQFGSYRSAAANSILFVGGPASNDTLFNDGFDP